MRSGLKEEHLMAEKDAHSRVKNHAVIVAAGQRSQSYPATSGSTRFCSVASVPRKSSAAAHQVAQWRTRSR